MKILDYWAITFPILRIKDVMKRILVGFGREIISLEIAKWQFGRRLGSFDFIYWVMMRAPGGCPSSSFPQEKRGEFLARISKISIASKRETHVYEGKVGFRDKFLLPAKFTPVHLNVNIGNHGEEVNIID